MKKVKHDEGSWASSSHVNLNDYGHMANVYYNYAVADKIESSNGAVTLSEDMLINLIKAAYINGWNSYHELKRQKDFDGDEYDSSSGKYHVHYSVINAELNKKHKYDDFADIIFNTPFHTKDYMMKQYNLSEEEMDKHIKEFNIKLYSYAKGRN